jgi:HEAT repeat protein
MGSARRPEVRHLLEGALGDPSPAVRRGAANALRALQERTAAAAIRGRLDVETSLEVAPALLLALGALGDETDVPRLTRAVARPQVQIKAASLGALAAIDPRAARPHALALLRTPASADKGFGVRAAAMLALAKAGVREDYPAVLATYERDKPAAGWFGRSAFARATAALAADPVSALAGLAEDEDPRVAVTAAVGLGRRGHKREVAALLQHASPGVRAAAIGAISQLGWLDAIPTLAQLARTDMIADVRWAAAKALFHLDTPAGDELIVAAVDAREAAVWMEALALLARRTGQRHGRNADAWARSLSSRRAAMKAR